MTVILRARFTVSPAIVGVGPALFQTYWRPGTLGGSTADATDILNRVRACIQACVASLGAGVTYTAQPELDGIEDTTGHVTAAFFGAAPGPAIGTSAGDPMPPQTAYLVHARTNLVVGPRLLKGRTYLFGATETQNTSAATPIAATVGVISAAFQGMVAGGTTLSFPVIWHKPGASAAPVGTNGPVTAYTCEANYWGSQRNRRF